MTMTTSSAYKVCAVCLLVVLQTAPNTAVSLTQSIEAPILSGAENTSTLCGTVRIEKPIRKRQWVPPIPVAPTPGKIPQARTFAYDRRLQLEVYTPILNATKEDGNSRFLRSCEINNIHVHTGTPRIGTLGFLKTLETRQRQLYTNSDDGDDESVVVLYIEDPSDTILAAEPVELLRAFQDVTVPKGNKSAILMPATRRCKILCSRAFDWPAVSVGTKYGDPSVLMGKLTDIIDLTHELPKPKPELQSLGLTTQHHIVTLYAGGGHGLAVDHTYKLFQSLAGYKNDIVDGEFSMHWKYRGKNDTRILNEYFQTFPGVILGSGNTGLLNQIGNYMPMQWLPLENLTNTSSIRPSCWRQKQEDHAAPAAPLCHVLLYVDVVSPFLSQVLEGLSEQVYPHDRIVLNVVIGPSAARHKHKKLIDRWHESIQNDSSITQYSTLTVGKAENLSAAVNASLREAQNKKADRFVMMTSLAFLNNTQTLRHLVEENRSAITPLLPREGKYFSNVWGSTTGGIFAQCFDEDPECPIHASKGYCSEGEFTEWMHLYCPASCGNCTIASRRVSDLGYKRSFDYHDIISSDDRKGVWSVPVILDFLVLNEHGISKAISGLDLVNNGLDDSTNATSFQSYESWEVFLTILQWIHERNGLSFVSNIMSFGHLIDPSDYNFQWKHPELFLLENNPSLWREMYIHTNYTPSGMTEWVAPECWDIFTFPLFNEAFCDHLIDDAELYGRWSGSSTYDDRLKGGYEPVPTQDIHFNQFGFHKSWEAVLLNFVKPKIEATFNGYTVRAKNTLDFIVRYKPDFQPSLRPHHDASTFSVTVALNKPGIDFQGGGTKYVRQNCTARGTKGHAYIHPGMLTHQHEGMPTTQGTRYIIVSFVDQPSA